ncbi:hypothetical protein GCM10010465_25510 [Actinomadura fibrosa]
MTLLFTLNVQAQTPPAMDGYPAEWPGVLAQPGVNGIYIEDPVNDSSDDIWDQGSADVNPVSNWTTKVGEPNDKNDLRNTAAVTIDNVIFFAADRYSNGGDADLGYWLLQDPVTKNGTGFNGAHQDGDVLIRTHFVNGGGATDRGIFIWMSGSLMEVTLPPAALNFFTNTTEVAVPSPWTYSPKSGTDQMYPPNSFVEGFLDLDALATALGDLNLDPCFSYFVISTGNSQSQNASLEDLVHGKYGNKPLSQDLTGSIICEGTRGGGTVTLADSEMGIGYQLQQYDPNTDLYTDFGDPKRGSGEELVFDNLASGSYYVKAYVPGSECFTRFGPVDIQINSVTPGRIGPDLTICEGDDPPAFRSVAADGTGTISYQWEVSLDGEKWRTYTNATNETFDSEPLTEDRWFRRKATSTLEGVECSATTDPVKITVNNITSGFIGADQTICEGDDPAPLLARPDEGDGDLSYQWWASTDNSVWREIPGEEAKNPIFDPGVLTADRWYKRVVTSTLNEVECSAESNVIKITVINFLPGEIGPDRLICAGDDPDVFRGTDASGDGSFKYQWQESADGEEWENIDSTTGRVYDPGQLEKDTYFRRLTTATVNDKDCVKESNTVLIYVNNVTAGNIAGDQVLCVGGDPEQISGRTGSGDGELSYQWWASVDGETFRILEGATGKDYDPAPFPEDERWYKRVTTSTVRDLDCSEESNVVKISKNNVTAGAIGPDQTICEGEDAAEIGSRSATADGRLSYYWLSSTDGENFEIIENAEDETYSPGKLTQDHWYRRGAVSTIGEVSCRAVTDPIRITVNNLTPGVIGSDQTICEGETPGALTTLTPASGDATITYQWQVSTDGTHFTDVPTNGETETYAPGVLYSDHWYRRVATAILNGTECERVSDPIKVTVENCIVCETAFAKAEGVGSPTCFIDDAFEDNPTSERWGWTNEFNGSSGDFQATMKLYAGAGQCVTSEEKMVGNVILDYNASEGTVKVTYDITKYGYAMNGVHLYVGCEPYPMKKKGKTSEPTVAPGKYPFNRSSSGYFDRFVTDPIDVGTGTFYVIAHANVCTSDKLWLYPILVDNEEVEYYTAKPNKPLEYVCDQQKGSANKTSISTTGSASLSGGDVNLSPVPFTNSLTVSYDFDYTSDVQIEIYDFKGKLLQTAQDTDVSRNSVTTIGLDFRTKGKQMYLLRITTDQETFVKQVVSK